jgi:hypothetical protein
MTAKQILDEAARMVRDDPGSDIDSLISRLARKTNVKEQEIEEQVFEVVSESEYTTLINSRGNW